MTKKTKIVVLGEGAWGTALATLLVRNGHEVVLWCHHPEIAEEINRHHTNTRYMPNCLLPATLKATQAVKEAVFNADFICEAIPVQYLRSVLATVRGQIDIDTPWIITSKGIEKETLLLPAGVVADALGYEPRFGVVVGPSFAREVMQQQDTGLVVASEYPAIRWDIAHLFANKYIECVQSADIHGAQLCSAFKNVVALLVGISDGQGHGDNARALLVTRCFEKLAALISASGGALETVHGLAGVGDLFLTASSTQSRNYTVGKALGAGETLESIIERTGFTPEGINTLHSMYAYAKPYGISFDDLLGISVLRDCAA